MVQNCPKRSTTVDAPTGPKEPRSTVLTPEEEAMVGRLPAATLLPLDEAVPYQIHTVLTDNGQQFCHAPRNRSGPTALYNAHVLTGSAASTESSIA